MKLTDLISEIRQFMAGPDQSNSPRLRRFLEEYSALCCELNRDLDKCRENIRRGSISEARKANLSFDPPLTQRVQMLNFPERAEFLALCSSYGYPLPPSFDEATLLLLNTPAAHSERKLAELMQHWRLQARSAGTAEKIGSLRSILELLPESSAAEWKKNLAALERQRDAEIAAELARREWNLPELAELQKLHGELRDPRRLTRAVENTLRHLEELLKPLQKQAVAASAEEWIDRMQRFYAERNLPELRSALEEWRKMKSHPLFVPVPEQLQTERDILQFLEEMDRDEVRRNRYEELLARIQQALAESVPYRELERLFGQLQLLELPLPESLVERMNVLREEFEGEERRKTVRRCVGSGIVALLLLLLLGGVLLVTMHFRRVKNVCGSYETLLQKGDFRSVLENYRTLCQEEPRIARDSRVKKVIQAAESESLSFQQNEKRAHELCKRNTAEIVKLLQNGLGGSEQVEPFFQELSPLKKYLDKAELDRISQLRTQVTKARSRTLLQAEETFENAAAAIFARLKKMKQEIRSVPDLAALSAELEQQKKRYRELLARTPKPVLEKLERKVALEWDTLLGDVEYRLKQERDFRDIRARLARPAGIPEFLTALGEARERQTELARLYARAMAPGQEVFLGRMFRAVRFIENENLADLLSGRKALLEEICDTPQGQDLFYCAFRSDGFDGKAFLENIIRNLNLYELVFQDEAGRPIVLYSASAPKIIRSPGSPEKIRGLRLEILPGRGQKSVPALLSLTDSAKKRFKLLIAAKQLPELADTGVLTLVSGLDLSTGKSSKNAAYILAVQFHAEKVSPENREEFFRHLFREMFSGTIQNVRLRAMLLCQLMAGLGKAAPVYADVFSSYLSRVENSAKAASVRDIFHPLCFQETEALQAALQSASAEELLEEKDRIVKFYFEMLSQGFGPQGIIDSRGKPYFHSPRRGRLLLAAPQSVYLLQSDLAAGKISEAEQKKLWPGEILWGFFEDFDCVKFFNPDAHKELKLYRRPAMWPQNLYFRND